MVADVPKFNKMATWVALLLVFTPSAYAKVTCYKNRPAPFGGVAGHQDSNAALFLGLSDGEADFDQMLLKGEKLRVHTTLSCSAGKSRYCHFQADGGQLVIVTTGDTSSIRLRGKVITVRTADESGESYLGLRPDSTTPSRAYIFDKISDAECSSLMKPEGPQAGDSADGEKPAPTAPPAAK